MIVRKNKHRQDSLDYIEINESDIDRSPFQVVQETSLRKVKFSY